MISAKLAGGLGNQMFQIAATHALALRNNDISGFKLDACYTPMQGYPSSTYRNTILANINDSKDYNFRVTYVEPRFSFEELPYTTDLILDGYFQSEKYFNDFSKDVKSLFTINTENAKKVLTKLAWYKLPITSVHIRRGDYTKNSEYHELCSIEYYKKAMEAIGQSIFIFISDDIEWVKQNFKGGLIGYSPFSNELDDLAIMTLCDNNIIANSSFSWWGAYLNPNPVKKVIAPKKWFGPSGPKDTEDIIPQNWLIIN
jgi:hypothetical protein